MAEEKIKVRLKPFKSIGGIGEPGDVVMMSKQDAEMYFRDGYVEYVEAETVVLPLPPAPLPMGEGSDHQIMKPQSKRIRK